MSLFVEKIGPETDDFTIPNGLSFFDPYLPYHITETLEIGGEAYLSRTSEGTVSGIFIYDDCERTGTVYTRSREVFDYFYGLKSFCFFFAEMRTEHDNEVYDIYTVDLESLATTHRFSHEISIADDRDTDEIGRFMVATHPGINGKWVNVALKNGDKCFIARLGSEIAGVGWLSLVNGIGRLHSLYVKPQFRGMGIGEDILYARLLWLKSKHARSAFSEIFRENFPSSRIAMKWQMRVSAQVFQYSKKDPPNSSRVAEASRF
jgi:GNAT superfamily N-acetyltransferase